MEVSARACRKRPTTPIEKVRQLQRKLWVCAKQSRTRRFHALYDRIYRSDVLWEAWRRVRSNGGAAGVDAETLRGHRATRAWSSFSAEIQADAAGRPISPFTGEAAIHTESRWEAAAIGDTDGAGPGGADGGEDRDRADLRGGFPSHAVMDSVRRGARRRPWKRSAIAGNQGHNFVVDADIQGYFDNIQRETLMELVKERISDRRVLKLIRQWLEAGVMEDGTVRETLAGTPQGGVISPLLANIYLNKLDRIWAAQV